MVSIGFQSKVKTFRLMDEQLVKTMAMVAGGLLAGVAITKATSALSDVSILYFCNLS